MVEKRERETEIDRQTQPDKKEVKEERQRQSEIECIIKFIQMERQCNENDKDECKKKKRNVKEHETEGEPATRSDRTLAKHHSRTRTLRRERFIVGVHGVKFKAGVMIRIKEEREGSRCEGMARQIKGARDGKKKYNGKTGNCH